MKLSEIQAKVAKGEALTDEEKKFLTEYDAEKATNDAVAAIRRKADEKYQKLKDEKDDLAKQVEDIQKQLSEKEDKGKTKEEQLLSQVASLSEQVTGLNKRLEEKDAENAKFARDAEIADLCKNAGIKFIQGVDEKTMSGAFNAAFNGIDDLSDETVTKPIVDRFIEANKAVILDDTGHGAGTPPHVGNGVTFVSGKNPWKTESFNLTEQGKVLKSNPAEAKRLKADAGIKE